MSRSTIQTKPAQPVSDKEFIEQSLNWPRWPFLPMFKRKIEHNIEDDGFLFSYSKEPDPIIYFGNIFGLNQVADRLKKEKGLTTVTYQQILDSFPHREFPSFEALLEVYRID